MNKMLVLGMLMTGMLLVAGSGFALTMVADDVEAFAQSAASTTLSYGQSAVAYGQSEGQTTIDVAQQQGPTGVVIFAKNTGEAMAFGLVDTATYPLQPVGAPAFSVVNSLVASADNVAAIEVAALSKVTAIPDCTGSYHFFSCVGAVLDSIVSA